MSILDENLNQPEAVEIGADGKVNAIMFPDGGMYDAKTFSAQSFGLWMQRQTSKDLFTNEDAMEIPSVAQMLQDAKDTLAETKQTLRWVWLGEVCQRHYSVSHILTGQPYTYTGEELAMLDRIIDVTPLTQE